jgi:uncharacterized protein YwlG (UPF0340 family)
MLKRRTSWTMESVVFITILEKNRLLLLGRSLTCVLGLTHSVCILSCTVDEDFKDVEETDFMDDGVRIAIQKMEHFIEQRTLKNRK